MKIILQLTAPRVVYTRSICNGWTSRSFDRPQVGVSGSDIEGSSMEFLCSYVATIFDSCLFVNTESERGTATG